MLVTVQWLRGIAALMVVYHHVAFQLSRAGGPKLPAAALGAAGVDLFFVISGFIMWITTVPARLPPGEFLIRRATRIVPLYWAVTAFMVALTLVLPHLLNTARFDVTHAVASFLFIPVRHPVMDEILPLYVQGWTINYEVFFYLAMGLCLFAPPKAWFGVLVGTLCLFSLGGAAGLAESSNAAVVFLTRPILLEFCFGLASGWLYLNLRAKGAGWPALAGLGIVLLLGSTLLDLHFGPNGTDPVRLLAWGAPAWLVVTGLALWERDRGAFRTGALSRLGDASYSIYMTHIIVLPLAAMAWQSAGFGLRGVPGAAYAICVFAPVCAVGWASYRLLERPSLVLLRRLRPSSGAARGSLAPG